MWQKSKLTNYFFILFLGASALMTPFYVYRDFTSQRYSHVIFDIIVGLLSVFCVYLDVKDLKRCYAAERASRTSLSDTESTIEKKEQQ